VVLPLSVRQVLDELPETALVLDVGGWADPDPRADFVLDIGSYETRYAYALLGQEIKPRRERFSAETWVQRDICDSGLWPFADGQFDFVLCTHTLEDIRDPIHVCRELARVGRAGYLETPSAATELTRGIESPLWCGWKHHRWLVWDEGNEVVFLGKPHHIHSPFWPSITSPRQLRPDARAPFSFQWNGSFSAREEILVDQGALDSRLQEIVARSAEPAPIAASRRLVAGKVWHGYRALRAAAGRTVRERGSRGTA
jgi:methyltransferase family protein